MGSHHITVLISLSIQVGDQDHEGLSLITDCLPSIQYKSESRHIPGGEFEAKRLLPGRFTPFVSNRSYSFGIKCHFVCLFMRYHSPTVGTDAQTYNCMEVKIMEDIWANFTS